MIELHSNFCEILTVLIYFRRSHHIYDNRKRKADVDVPGISFSQRENL